ncbi:hypothetical protein Tco_1370347 [Tanacetum coccineum]
MPSPRPAAYSPTEIPSGESKVHIEVLSVLWGNRLPIPDGSLPLSRYKGLKRKQKRARNYKSIGGGWTNGMMTPGTAVTVNDWVRGDGWTNGMMTRVTAVMVNDWVRCSRRHSGAFMTMIGYQ